MSFAPGPIRAAHRFDEAALERYLAKAVAGFEGPLSVQQFGGGQSNPTFLLSAGGKRYVMRKKPPGVLLKSAHQVDREYRIMKALAATDVPVPKMHALCEDESVVGTAFYVMDFLEGRIFRDPQLPGVAPAERAAIYDSMNDVLARLHKVDLARTGLSDFGKPGNYFDRQVARWITQYRAAQTDQIPDMEKLIDWMPLNIPKDDSVSIAHGDYRLENTIFHPTEPRMIAVLDWELSTIGHPLADLAYNCMGYHVQNPRQGGLVGVDYAASGIPSEADYVAKYCARVGRGKIENWSFYLSFAVFRLASIAQGVYKRGLDGNASSETAAQFGNTCQFLAEHAWRLANARL
ncbi:MAG: phosphotransferase [Alphaproteobacteria bacterium]|nr:phosphotransferase [Alphaproteobacteria bacterium]